MPGKHELQLNTVECSCQIACYTSVNTVSQTYCGGVSALCVSRGIIFQNTLDKIKVSVSKILNILLRALMTEFTNSTLNCHCPDI